jgi:hypothetical protein
VTERKIGGLKQYYIKKMKTFIESLFKTFIAVSGTLVFNATQTNIIILHSGVPCARIGSQVDVEVHRTWKFQILFLDTGKDHSHLFLLRPWWMKTGSSLNLRHMMRHMLLACAVYTLYNQPGLSNYNCTLPGARLASSSRAWLRLVDHGPSALQNGPW